MAGLLPAITPLLPGGNGSWRQPRFLLLLAVPVALGCSGTFEANGGDARIFSDDVRISDDDLDLTDSKDSATDRGNGDLRGDLPDDDLLPNTYDPPPMTRARRWTRENPMFVSALTVSMGAPPSSAVNEYYDDFHANATHLWADGMPTEVLGWAAAGRQDFRFVSWLRNDGLSAGKLQLVGGLPAHAGRIGYQVGDEPGIVCPDDGLTCARDDLVAMSDGIDAVRKVDPDALIFVNFFNHDELVALLDYYGKNVDGDLISYDRYALGHGAYSTMETVRAAGLKYDKPYWRYLEAFTYKSKNDTYTESDFRWSAMAGLLYGFTGHTWFVYTYKSSTDSNPSLYEYDGSFSAPKTPLWAAAAQVNLELKNLGRCITQLISTDVRYVPSVFLLQPKGTRVWEPGAGNDPYLTVLAPGAGANFLDISIGYFKDDWQDIYFMVQNVSHTSGDFPVNLGGPNTIHMAFDFSSAPVYVQRDHLLTLNKLTGVVEQIALTDLGDNRASLDVTLASGDVILLKYDTTRTFALRPQETMVHSRIAAR